MRIGSSRQKDRRLPLRWARACGRPESGPGADPEASPSAGSLSADEVAAPESGAGPLPSLF
jgi:hypothetical protein